MAASKAEAPPAPEAPPRPAPRPKPRTEPREPSELERLEQRIQATEAEVARLEQKLAQDWTNMDVLAGHRAARDELRQLLERWEVLFTEAESR